MCLSILDSFYRELNVIVGGLINATLSSGKRDGISEDYFIVCEN